MAANVLYCVYEIRGIPMLVYSLIIVSPNSINNYSLFHE